MKTPTKSGDLTLTGLRQAERFVYKQQALGNDVRWEGFDTIIFFRESDQGMTSPDGAFRHGVWGFDNRFSCDSNGVWSIDYRNVRRNKSTRS